MKPLLKRCFPIQPHFLIRRRDRSTADSVSTWELAGAIAQDHRTYAEIAKALIARYETRPFPTPQFEGDLARSLLLDSRQVPQRLPVTP